MKTKSTNDKSINSGTFRLFGQKLINIIIHREDVDKILPVNKGRACIIHLKNKVPYVVGESMDEVYRKLSWS